MNLKSLTFLGIFCRGVKIYHFSSEIIFGQLWQTFGDFFLVTLEASNLLFSSKFSFSVSLTFLFLNTSLLKQPKLLISSFWLFLTYYTLKWQRPLSILSSKQSFIFLKIHFRFLNFSLFKYVSLEATKTAYLIFLLVFNLLHIHLTTSFVNSKKQAIFYFPQNFPFPFP